MYDGDDYDVGDGGDISYYYDYNYDDDDYDEFSDMDTVPYYEEGFPLSSSSSPPPPPAPIAMGYDEYRRQFISE